MADGVVHIVASQGPVNVRTRCDVRFLWTGAVGFIDGGTPTTEEATCMTCLVAGPP